MQMTKEELRKIITEERDKVFKSGPPENVNKLLLEIKERLDAEEISDLIYELLEDE